MRYAAMHRAAKGIHAVHPAQAPRGLKAAHIPRPCGQVVRRPLAHREGVQSLETSQADRGHAQRALALQGADHVVVGSIGGAGAVDQSGRAKTATHR